jgi:hypothetical protein
MADATAFGTFGPAIHGWAYTTAARQCRAKLALIHPADAGCIGRGSGFPVS